MNDTPTRADLDCMRADLAMLIAEARMLPANERRAKLERWRYVGPHRSVTFALSADDIDRILEGF